MSGLKPNHFYNVRIIAVGPNNHQTGSRLLRLRTFGEDGRPRLGTSRLPSGFEETARSKQADGSEDSSRPVATFGTSQGPDPPPAATREGSATGATPTARRNTGGRRHSPSVNSLDRPPAQGEANGPSEAQMAELNQKYLGLRRETEEATAAIAKEEDETRRQLEELEMEKQERRKEQKKKEEQTEKLKKEQGMTDRVMRAAEKQKAQKEKQLKDKRAELTRLRDGMAKWEKGIADMRTEQDSYGKQKVKLAEDRDAKGGKLQDENAALKKDCADLETQLKEVRQTVKELEDARKGLPGHEEDAGWRESMVDLRKDWQRREISCRNELLAETRRQQQLDGWIHQLNQLRPLQQTGAGYGLYEQGNSSGFDFDASHGHLKRRSRNSVSLSNPAAPSPVQAYHGLDHAVSSAAFDASLTSVPSGFVTGPFMGHSADGAESDPAALRTLTADAPLSPSATDHLLPSGIFADDEPSGFMPQSLGAAMLPMHNASPDNDPQSPASSGRSASLLSSRQGSSNNLPYTQYEIGRPLGPLESPRAAPGLPVTNRLGNLFRHRATKGLDEGGPALGTLKAGQSQSFPRQTDDVDVAKAKRGLASPWPFNRNSAGPELLEGQASPAWRTGFSARNFLPFGSKPAGSVLPERDPSSPRPASIASSDLPRPSTDSASIWGPPVDSGLGKPSHLWPNNGWSRNPSRRPSIHGSANALKTNLASADDEILNEAELQNPQVSPSQVGVIGSRPPAAKKSLAKSLNPAAQPFKTIFRTKPDKEGSKEKERTRGKDKDRSKDKGKGRGRDAPPETPQAPSIMVDESPSESRLSRDALSLHTQTDVSESRESLSMEHSISQVSHTTSEPGGNAAAGPKDPDSAFRKLFRKDSTSKLSFSQKFKRSKGPGSVTNSEKNLSTTERSSMGDGDEAGGEPGTGFDSVTSSPSLGPAKFKDKPESKLKPSGSWFSIKKKTKDKESLEMDRASLDTAGE